MTEQEAAVLAFEARWWRQPGAKDAAITADLGLTPVRYYALLARLIRTERALAADPLLVRRLQRIAGARRRTA